MKEMLIAEDVAAHRRPDRDVLPLFLNRWSPRSFTEESVDPAALEACFEAARWAPSSSNEQPWRFLYARTEEDRRLFASCLVEFNQLWAGKAPVLVAVCARTRFAESGEPNRHGAFDTGAAWVLLALEATRRGLYAHAMAGFDEACAREILRIPADHDILCFVALGHAGRPEALPERMRKSETPRGRRPAAEFVTEGAFPKG